MHWHESPAVRSYAIWNRTIANLTTLSDAGYEISRTAYNQLQSAYAMKTLVRLTRHQFFGQHYPTYVYISLLLLLCKLFIAVCTYIVSRVWYQEVFAFFQRVSLLCLFTDKYRFAVEAGLRFCRCHIGAFIPWLSRNPSSLCIFFPLCRLLLQHSDGYTFRENNFPGLIGH